jgi:hypothetical protein
MNQHLLDEKKTRLGRMGEICVGNWASSEGKTVIHSIDPYDIHKDLMINYLTVEVKTQIPYINERAFSIRPNQLRKCREVNELYFVALPSSNERFAYDGQGWIYKVDPKTFKHRETVTRGGTKMILIDMNQEAVMKVKQIDEHDLHQMMKYTTGG